MKMNQLLVLSAASLMIGSGGLALTSQAIANPFNLVAQTSDQPADGLGRKGFGKGGFARLANLTEAQRTQLRQIHESIHQRIAAIPTAEQKARMTTIRQAAKAQKDAVLTAEQRQQLQQQQPPATSTTETPDLGRKGHGKGGLARLANLTEAQRTQLRQIHESTRQQMDVVLTAEQKAQIAAIRQEGRTQMDAVLTAEQRQQLEQQRQLREQRQQQRQQQET